MSTHAQVGPRVPVARPTRSRAGRGPSCGSATGWNACSPELGQPDVRVEFAEHHQSHAAAAFYPSPFERAAILTFDGVGEWATSTIGWGAGHRIEVRQEQAFPDSLGLLYSAMTAFCGFDVNDGEYKLMGLRPTARPVYADVLREHVHIHVHDGSVQARPAVLRLPAGSADDPSPPRRPAARRPATGTRRRRSPSVTPTSPDPCRTVLEAVLKIAWHARKAHRRTVRLCLAGGVALNCVANARLLADGPFDDLWVQPAAGDTGSAIGAALWAWHQLDDNPRSVSVPDGMAGAALGPAFGADEVAWLARASDIPFQRVARPRDARATVASASPTADRRLVPGAMEFGPRALGHRSILADPRHADMSGTAQLPGQAARERSAPSPRPCSPSTPTSGSRWTDDRPYMTVDRNGAERPHGDAHVGPVAGDFAERLAQVRSTIPACTHVDSQRGCRPSMPSPQPRLPSAAGALPRQDRGPPAPQHVVQRGGRADRAITR